jgi:hypothetical protein
VLAGREKTLGPEHPATLDSVNDLASLLFKQGQLEQAKAMYERALAGREKTLGPEHADTCRTRNNVDGLDMAMMVKDDFEHSLASIPCASHEGHALVKVKSIYNGSYGCDLCGVLGFGWAYTCELCGFDAHPQCVLSSCIDI